MSKGPSALAAFSYNWIGGDIRGLSGLAGSLYEFADQSNEPAAALDRTLNGLVSDSGDSSWKGTAAGDFKADFEKDVTDIHWLSGRVSSVAGVVDGLAVTLAKIENWLESQAEKGVQAGYITLDASGKMGLPSGTSNPQVQKFLQGFNQCREQALAAAKKAREAAAGKLGPEYQALAGGLTNYKNNHRNLLSASEEKALESNLKGLDQSFHEADGRRDPSHAPGAHEKSLLKDAVMTATTIIGGTAGGVVGTFVEPGGGTLAGVGVGGLVGQAAGSALGSIFD